MVDMCLIAEWHLVTGTIRLPDILSGNRMPRLRDYIYIVPTIRLPDEMSGKRDYIYIDIYGMVIKTSMVRLPDISSGNISSGNQSTIWLPDK